MVVVWARKNPDRVRVPGLLVRLGGRLSVCASSPSRILVRRQSDLPSRNRHRRSNRLPGSHIPWRTRACWTRSRHHVFGWTHPSACQPMPFSRSEDPSANSYIAVVLQPSSRWAAITSCSSRWNLQRSRASSWRFLSLRVDFMISCAAVIVFSFFFEGYSAAGFPAALWWFLVFFRGGDCFLLGLVSVSMGGSGAPVGVCVPCDVLVVGVHQLDQIVDVGGWPDVVFRHCVVVVDDAVFYDGSVDPVEGVLFCIGHFLSFFFLVPPGRRSGCFLMLIQLSLIP